VIGAICLVALAGLELVQRLVPAGSRQPHNDVAGFIYAALGVIYAVLLALVVIAVWEEYGAAKETVEQEANAAADIFWLADRLPEPRGTHIQELVRSYAEEVVQREWPLMEQGQAPLISQTRGTPAGWTIIDDIRQDIQNFEPRTKAEEQLYAEGLDQVDTLSDARRMRLVAAEEGIPGVLWAVLIFGGIAAIGFDPGSGYRAGAVHHRGPGAPLLRRRPHRHGSLRSDTGEIPDQQAKRHPIEFATTPLFSRVRGICVLRTSR
jgi:Protein of unknown function (DUF4239)